MTDELLREAGRTVPGPQAVVTTLTSAAIFLVAEIGPGARNARTVRSLCGDLAGLARAVGFRDLEGRLSCVTGFGSRAWDRLTTGPRPAGLHPFREIRAGHRHAVVTPGDLLFHIRATRMDLCFELAAQIFVRLDGAVTVLDEVHGFRYFVRLGRQRRVRHLLHRLRQVAGRDRADAGEHVCRLARG
ncbi:MAG TPA: Dyp-type peroxidase domain-containing protein [Streptosporangiaceae bacterium]